MNKHAKKIRKEIIEYIKEQMEIQGIRDYDLYDGYDLGVEDILNLLKEIFNGIE